MIFFVAGFKRVAWPPPPDEPEPAPVIEEQAPPYSLVTPYTHAKTVPPAVIEVPKERSWESQIGSRPTPPQTSSPVGFQTPAPVRTYQPVNFEPPPTTITLRPSPPIRQVSNCNYFFQPYNSIKNKKC